MEAVFRLVWTTSVYAGFVGIILMILKTLLKDRISPKWHYLLWLILIMKLLVPFGPESAVSLFNVVQPVSQEIDFVRIYGQVQAGGDTQTSRDDIPPEQTQMPPAGGNASAHTWIAMTGEMLPYIWLFGAVVILSWLLYTNHTLTRKLKTNGNPAPEAIRLLLENCKKTAGIRGNPRIIVQDVVKTPSLTGVFRPKILLTPVILNLREQEISYILLHELAHYKRKDLPANCLLLLLQVIHWFNPVIWYCFLKIRQDMEVAADESVLALLDVKAHKEYGRALLAVLESFSLKNRLVPRLVGMVDDRKNIERRIKMIKMAELFQSKRRKVFFTGIFCFIILGCLLWTSAAAKEEEYNLQELLKYKTDYVGDNVKVVQLIDRLTYAHSRQEVSLQTEKQPYGISVKYHFQPTGADSKQIPAALTTNALVLFALIKNLDVLNLNWSIDGQEHRLSLTRAELQESYPRDLREYAKDAAAFETLLNSRGLTLFSYPEKYTPAMSSIPGIKIAVQYDQTAAQVKYSVDRGNLLTWDGTTGKISNKGKTAELSLTTPIYWSPSEDHPVKYQENDEIPVKISIWNKNGTVAEKQLTIKYSDSMYTVKPAPDLVISDKAQLSTGNPKSIDEAVSLAVKGRGDGYLAGEVAAEGHLILEVEEKDTMAIAYTIASFSWFGFENGIFTGISGCGAIPTVITFVKNKNGEYFLQEYKEPTDGAGYTESIQKMFPKRLWARVFQGDHYPQLVKQLEEQARQYLQGIGRNAEVKLAHVEKQLARINVEASNKLFAEFTKRDSELNLFPYWLGTKEYLVNGERFIYETSQSKSSDGYDLISFKKTKEDGTLVLEYQYKIVGNQPERVSLQSGISY